MKRLFIKATMICMIALSPLLLRAETIVHNFQNLVNASQISFSGSNKIGTTDLVTYTCSGGTAQFTANSTSGSKIAAFLTNNNNAQMVITPAISDLDSLRISYRPLEDRTILVAISDDGGSSWTNVSVDAPINGVRQVKLPAKGDYCVRIKRSGDDFCITEIKYITAPCHCLKVVEEE